MPALTTDDRVKFSARRLPGFKGRHFDLHSAVTREPRQPRVRVNPEQLATGRLKLSRHNAGGNAHVENEPSRGRSRNTLDQDVGIARPGPVIARGIRPERLRRLPLLMRLVLGNGRGVGWWHPISMDVRPEDQREHAC